MNVGVLYKKKYLQANLHSNNFFTVKKVAL